MKKIFKCGLLLCCILILCSCSLSNDNLEGSTIYVTNYPIKYLVDIFYKNHAKIESIYPSDSDTTTYQLTEKQIKDYSKGSMFVYNGLTSEKNLAKEFLAKNKNLLISDVSYGLAIQYSTEELWLSPNNYLMLAKNVRESFKEYLNNKTVKEEIESKYNALAETLSIMDADLRNIGSSAKNKNKALVVGSTKAYKFLENYGFTVVTLDDEAYKTDEGINTIKNNFKNGKYNILICDSTTENDLVTSLINDYKATPIELLRMTHGIPNDDYINILQQFINRFRNSLAN